MKVTDDNGNVFEVGQSLFVMEYFADRCCYYPVTIASIEVTNEVILGTLSESEMIDGEQDKTMHKITPEDINTSEHYSSVEALLIERNKKVLDVLSTVLENSEDENVLMTRFPKEFADANSVLKTQICSYLARQ